MSASKMNSFLQRMLKKNSNEELNVKNECEEEQKTNETTRSGFSKGNWIRKHGNYSPSKRQVPASPIRTNTMKALDRSGLCNTYEATTPQRTSGSPQTPLEMPDLESIIREFEMGFLSPSKQDGSADGSKQKNFVKKIVAAFEVKYKSYNDLKTAQEARENHEGSKLDTTIVEAPKRRSGIFNSPFKSTYASHVSPSKQNEDDASENSTNSSPSKNDSIISRRRSGIFASPFKSVSDEEKDLNRSFKAAEGETKSESRRSGIFYTPCKDKSEDSRCYRKSGLFVTPFNRRDSRDASISSSEIYTSPIHLENQDSKDSSSDCSSLFKFDKQESNRRSNFHLNSPKVSTFNDTKIIEDIDLDMTLPEPEETIFVDGNTLRKTSTMINEFTKDGDILGLRDNSVFDKTPKIVGAFLKKPIEVEDTSIDWIPITGKKLPRKRSLKKLLYSLTGKKLEKKSKLFSSERNLSEESREFQDSGYDERSCSSSSLTSLISITEVLLQQENSYIESNRRTTLKTFRSKNSLDEEEDEAFCDAYRSTSKLKRGQLLLTEVPREDVKLDLGPSYPPSKMVTMSLDRKTVSKKTCNPSPMYERLTRIPKHPHLSKIPKHPFVAVTKMDGSQEFCSSQERRGSKESTVIVKNDLYEVEFRRSCGDLRSSASCRSSSTGSCYDVPRRFLSKSENEISSMCQSTVIRKSEPVYDIPRPQSIDRPRSSVYEDALSLKRRTICTEVQVGLKTYSVPRHVESHYATIKPRNTKIYFNSEILHTFNNVATMEKSSAF